MNLGIPFRSTFIEYIMPIFLFGGAANVASEGEGEAIMKIIGILMFTLPLLYILNTFVLFFIKNTKSRLYCCLSLLNSVSVTVFLILVYMLLPRSGAEHVFYIWNDIQFSSKNIFLVVFVIMCLNTFYKVFRVVNMKL